MGSVQVVDNYSKVWEPFPKQVEFIEIPDTVFEALYGGAVGGGKSELLLMLPVVRRWVDNPYFHGIIFRKTFPQLEESLIPRSREFYNPLGATYNESKHVWTFPSGAMIRLSYMERDVDALNHDTAEYNYIGFDELTHFTFFQYSYLTSRVRSGKSGLPKIVRTASNPGNIGHMWVRERFIEPAPNGGVLIFDNRSKSKRIFIRSRITDNPYILKNDPDYINRLYILPEAERRAKMDGDWWVFAGQVFTEFRVQPNTDEPAFARHVVPYFEPPDWWPRIVACDWGYTAKTWVGWAAIAPDTRVYVYRELVREKTAIELWAADVLRASQFELGSIAACELDPSAWQERGQKTIAKQIMDATPGMSWNPADNDRLGGKLLMHEMLRWTPRPPRYTPKEGYSQEVANKILRLYGQKKFEEYGKMFEPEPVETNLPRLQIMNNCSHLINTIPLCVYETRKDRITEDVAEFNGDDPYDGSRYLIKAVDNYLRGVQEEHRKRQQIAQIQGNLATTGDMTAFYRQMEKLEAEQQTVVEISRHHNFRHSPYRRRR